MSPEIKFRQTEAITPRDVVGAVLSAWRGDFDLITHTQSKISKLNDRKDSSRYFPEDKYPNARFFDITIGGNSFLVRVEEIHTDDTTDIKWEFAVFLRFFDAGKSKRLKRIMHFQSQPLDLTTASELLTEYHLETYGFSKN